MSTYQRSSTRKSEVIANLLDVAAIPQRGHFPIDKARDQRIIEALESSDALTPGDVDTKTMAAIGSMALFYPRTAMAAANCPAAVGSLLFHGFQEFAGLSSTKCMYPNLVADHLWKDAKPGLGSSDDSIRQITPMVLLKGMKECPESQTACIHPICQQLSDPGRDWMVHACLEDALTHATTPLILAALGAGPQGR